MIHRDRRADKRRGPTVTGQVAVVLAVVLSLVLLYFFPSQSV